MLESRLKGGGFWTSSREPQRSGLCKKQSQNLPKRLPEIALTDDSILKAATPKVIRPESFRYIRRQISERLHNVGVNFWFDGKKRAATEIIKFFFIGPGRKSIVIGMFLLTHNILVEKLKVALAYGVAVKLI